MLQGRSWARNCMRILVSAASLCGSVALVQAQERWPAQPIKLVVPYPAGGSTDLVARQLSEALGKELGQPIVIDNRPGGGTNIGAEAVARARPDGYTFLFGGNAQVLNYHFGPKPSFELTALEPVSLVSRLGFAIGANPQTPYRTGAAMLAAAKAAPGKLTISSAQLDLYVELMGQRAGAKLLHVPYKGGAAAVTDAMSGQVDMAFALLPVMLPQIQGGKLKALAITSAQRHSALPDVPTLKEIGVDYDLTIWYALWATAGTPKAVIDRMAEATAKVLASPDMVARLRAGGAEPESSTPQHFREVLKKQDIFWKDIARSMPNLVQK